MTTDATQNLNIEILLNLPEHLRRHRSVTTSTITDEEQRANVEFLGARFEDGILTELPVSIEETGAA